MIPLWKMHTACDAAPRKAQTLEEHLKQYHKGQMPKGECKFIKQWKKEHPEDFAATKNEDDTETASKNAGASGGGSDASAKFDAAYLKAVESGDMKTCAKMVADAAARKMPKTKVVDADGKPLAAWHETDWKPYDGNPKEAVFDIDEDSDGVAWFASRRSRKGYESGENAYQFYLNVERPKTIEDESYLSSEMGADAMKKSNDGAIFTSTADKGRNVFTVRKPTQIKSADPITYDADGNVIPLSKRFDFTNPDIRY